MTNSWLGGYQTVYRILAEIGADFSLDDEESKIFLIEGPMVLGLGGLEVIVGPDVKYFIDGEPQSLLDRLRTANDGIVVGVF